MSVRKGRERERWVSGGLCEICPIHKLLCSCIILCTCTINPIGSEGSATQAGMASGTFKTSTGQMQKKGLLTYAGITRLGERFLCFYLQMTHNLNI